MALTPEQLKNINDAGKGFLVIRRPPPEMRDRLDIDFRVEGQSVFIYEIRPNWRDSDEKKESPLAKATYVQTTNRWKIYLLRADLKWHGYEPDPEVNSITDFFKIVHEDAMGCFWG